MGYERPPQHDADDASLVHDPTFEASSRESMEAAPTPLQQFQQWIRQIPPSSIPPRPDWDRPYSHVQPIRQPHKNRFGSTLLRDINTEYWDGEQYRKDLIASMAPADFDQLVATYGQTVGKLAFEVAQGVTLTAGIAVAAKRSRWAAGLLAALQVIGRYALPPAVLAQVYAWHRTVEGAKGRPMEVQRAQEQFVRLVVSVALWRLNLGEITAGAAAQKARTASAQVPALWPNVAANARQLVDVSRSFAGTSSAIDPVRAMLASEPLVAAPLPDIETAASIFRPGSDVVAYDPTTREITSGGGLRMSARNVGAYWDDEFWEVEAVDVVNKTASVREYRLDDEPGPPMVVPLPEVTFAPAFAGGAPDVDLTGMDAAQQDFRMPATAPSATKKSAKTARAKPRPFQVRNETKWLSVPPRLEGLADLLFQAYPADSAGEFSNIVPTEAVQRALSTWHETTGEKTLPGVGASIHGLRTALEAAGIGTIEYVVRDQAKGYRLRTTRNPNAKDWYPVAIGGVEILIRTTPHYLAALNDILREGSLLPFELKDHYSPVWTERYGPGDVPRQYALATRLRINHALAHAKRSLKSRETFPAGTIELVDTISLSQGKVNEYGFKPSAQLRKLQESVSSQAAPLRKRAKQEPYESNDPVLRWKHYNINGHDVWIRLRPIPRKLFEWLIAQPEEKYVTIHEIRSFLGLPKEDTRLALQVLRTSLENSGFGIIDYDPNHGYRFRATVDNIDE
jgi:hypothetical protein